MMASFKKHADEWGNVYRMMAGVGGIVIFIHAWLIPLLTKTQPPVTFKSEVQQKLTDSGNGIALEAEVIKSRDCKLRNIESLTGTLEQQSGEIQHIVHIEPFIPMRPGPRTHERRIVIDIPHDYNATIEGVLLIDFQYDCEKGTETVYMDIPIRPFTAAELTKKMIMDKARQEREQMNQRGSWNKG